MGNRGQNGQEYRTCNTLIIIIIITIIIIIIKERKRNRKINKDIETNIFNLYM